MSANFLLGSPQIMIVYNKPVVQSHQETLFNEYFAFKIKDMYLMILH